MSLAKLLGRNPSEVARNILAHLNVADEAQTPQVAAPGFINIRLRGDWVSRELGRANPDERLGVPHAEKPETVVVDYSAPNLAKEMHVGHLRSTIIGDALVRMLEFVSHRVIRQNHVGDWGTQFGMLVTELQDRKVFVPGIGADNTWHEAYPGIADLETFYRQAKQRFDTEPDFARRSRETVVLVQSGDDKTHWLWVFFCTTSLDHCSAVYKKLGVKLTDEDIRGESAYNDDLPKVVEDLRAKGLLTESEGAQCVFLDGFVAKDSSPLPLIVQKSDEGFLYATTDLAAIRYRVSELHANRILYVVDARQSLHFQMLFACARKAGFAPPDAALVHVAFGTMMGPDGRPFKTREGGTVKLMDLLDEAEKRAYELVSAKSPDLPETEKRDIAHKVGIGAVKYADLAQSRTSDYVFSWDKMLSLDGNTAPYMQYAYARVRSIFRKGGHEAEEHRQDAAPIAVEAPAEIALAKMILRFPEALDRTLEDYRPNVLAAYLYDLAQAFTAFYDACPVIQSQGPTRANRLKLCDLTARVIARGLGLLGIETAERM
jgi:arginyl-tRNA synthetase